MILMMLGQSYIVLLQNAASMAFERAAGAYASATADFVAIGDCVSAFQTAASCRRNAVTAVANGSSAQPHSETGCCNLQT